MEPGEDPVAGVEITLESWPGDGEVEHNDGVTALRPRYEPSGKTDHQPGQREYQVHGAGAGRRPKSRSRSIALAAGCALAVVACGSSGKPRNRTGSSGSAPAVAYADCIRSHGVQNFPDANSGGGLEIPSTINPQSPTYISARRACAKLQPGPIVPGPPSERQERQLVASARCMRKYGVSVADPTFQGPYITLDVPDETTMQSPAFKRAEKACGYPPEA